MLIFLHPILMTVSNDSHGLDLNRPPEGHKQTEEQTLGRSSYWGLEQAIRNFEDMRINAKENDILSDLSRTSVENPP